MTAPPLKRLWLAAASVAVATGVMALGPYRELAELSAGSGGTLDETARRTAAEVAAHLDAVGTRGLELYRAHFWWDAPFLAANALFLWAVLTVALPRARFRVAPRLAAAVTVLPLIAAALDVVENLAVARLVATAAAPGALATTVAWAATTAKLTLFAAAAVATVVSVVGCFVGRRRGGATTRTASASTAASPR